MSIFGEEHDDYENLLNKIVTQTLNPSHVYDEVYEALIKNKSYALYGEYPKDLKIKADYTTIPILDIENPNVTDEGNIKNALHNILKGL